MGSMLIRELVDRKLWIYCKAGRFGGRKNHWIINYSAPADTDNNMVLFEFNSFALHVSNLCYVSIYLITAMDICVIDICKMLLLYFIFNKQDVRENRDIGSVTFCSHQSGVDSLHTHRN